MTEPEIPPALTPEEWRPYHEVTARSWVGAPYRTPYSVQRDPLTIEVTSNGSLIVDDAEASDNTVIPADALPAVIALANAALPDGDPRKLTREDVTALRRVAENSAALSADDLECGDTLRRLAAKIAALLPTEGT